MTTKAAFITAKGGALIPDGRRTTFVRTSGDILTATAHGLETGAGPFKVMNNVADAPSGITVAKHSEGTLGVISAIATDVFVVDGKTYTIINTPAADGDVDTGANDTKMMANMAAAINQNVDAAATTYDLDTVPNTTVNAFITDNQVLTIQAKTLDSAIGDAIDIASVDSTITASAANLANGADGTDYYIIRLDADTFSLATTKVLAEAGTAVTLADAGTGINTLVTTVQTLADALEDVVTNRLTYKGTRSLPADFNIASFWEAAIDGTAAMLD